MTAISIGSARTVQSVVDGLFEDMDQIVTAYDAGAIKVHARVEGTAFFPGGSGLWRGVEPFGAGPALFPSSPLMVLGHNFDKVSGLNASARRGIEQMNGATWLILRRYLQAASVDASECFFTNVFVGLQPHSSLGEMRSSEEYKRQCRQFLHRQMEWVRPRAVAILGKPAEEQYKQSRCSVPYIKLHHPYFAFAKGSDSEHCRNIVEPESLRLKTFLSELDDR